MRRVEDGLLEPFDLTHGDGTQGLGFVRSVRRKRLASVGPVTWGAAFGTLTGLVGALVLAATLGPPPLGSVLTLGRLADYPPGSVTEVTKRGSFVDPTVRLIDGHRFGRTAPLRLFVVRIPSGELLAFSARDPRNGCRLTDTSPGVHGGLRYPRPGFPPSRWFYDPCHYAQYSPAGACVAGPCAVGLSRFDTSLIADQRVSVDLLALHAGPLRTEPRQPAVAPPRTSLPGGGI